MFRSRLKVAADREFIVFEGKSYSYREAERYVQATSAALKRRGVKAGDRVGVYSTNHPTSVFLLLALADLGAIMAPVNPEYGAEEVRYIFSHAEVCGIVCAPDLYETAVLACSGMPSRPWIILNESTATAESSGGNATLQDEILKGSSPIENHQASAASTCVFIYTSGTTGFPKAVMHSQGNLVTAGEGFVERMHLQPADRLLCILPLFHVNAIFYSLGGALAAGATLVLERRFSASNFWKIVKETRATEVNTIAAAASILMRRPRTEFVEGHHLQKMYGAPFDEETYRVFQEEFAVPTLIEGYGMSEIPGALNNPFPGPHKIRSMGQPSRHPQASVQLAQVGISDDSGALLPPGEIGELVVKTPIVMQGYFKDAGQTEAAFRDGWFLTGDLAYYDKEGYYWFVARKKDIIRRRGENISGAELDRVIGNHPAVLEAAAIPVPSELGEDDILVAVVPRPEMTVKPEDIEVWCRNHLSAIKVPRYVAIVDELPHTPTHRVAKFKLRDDVSIRTAATDLQAR
ncbi:class I adenylate-forming enzyme family protein [Ottowia sp. VDI28]